MKLVADILGDAIGVLLTIITEQVLVLANVMDPDTRTGVLIILIPLMELVGMGGEW